MAGKKRVYGLNEDVSKPLVNAPEIINFTLCDGNWRAGGPWKNIVGICCFECAERGYVYYQMPKEGEKITAIVIVCCSVCAAWKEELASNIEEYGHVQNNPWIRRHWDEAA